MRTWSGYGSGKAVLNEQDPLRLYTVVTEIDLYELLCYSAIWLNRVSISGFACGDQKDRNIVKMRLKHHTKSEKS